MKKETTQLLYSIDENEKQVFICLYTIDNSIKKPDLFNFASCVPIKHTLEEVYDCIIEAKEKIPEYEKCICNIVENIDVNREALNSALLWLHINITNSKSFIDQYYSKIIYDTVNKERNSIKWESYNPLPFFYKNEVKKSSQRIKEQFERIKEILSNDECFQNAADIETTPKQTVRISCYDKTLDFQYADAELENFLFDFGTVLKNYRYSFSNDSKKPEEDFETTSPITIKDLRDDITGAIRTKICRLLKYTGYDTETNNAIEIERKIWSKNIKTTFNGYKEESRTEVDRDMLEFQNTIYYTVDCFLEKLKNEYDKRHVIASNTQPPCK